MNNLSEILNATKKALLFLHGSIPIKLLFKDTPSNSL